jgi:hypothetical protein
MRDGIREIALKINDAIYHRPSTCAGKFWALKISHKSPKRGDITQHRPKACK